MSPHDYQANGNARRMAVALGLPSDSWVLHGVDEYETPQTCELCGYFPIRWFHEIHHPEGHQINTGGCCAAGLTGDLEVHLALEAAAKAWARRRGKWCGLKKWRWSARGNRFINHLNHHVVVYQAGQRWGYALDGKRSPQLYTAEGNAMLGAFDAAWPKPRRRDNLSDFDLIFGR